MKTVVSIRTTQRTWCVLWYIIQVVYYMTQLTGLEDLVDVLAFASLLVGFLNGVINEAAGTEVTIELELAPNDDDSVTGCTEL